MRNKCNNCYFGGLCRDKGYCPHYSPIKERDDNSYMMEQERRDREDFTEAWKVYVAEYSDGNEIDY